jgi:hypothetical protein
MLKLAALINNPGEPPAESRYNDPAALKQLGYTDRVFYETTALSGLESVEVIGDPELRRWLHHTEEQLLRQIDQAREAGLGVYLFYDMLVLPTDLLQHSPGNYSCRRQPNTLCPASETTLTQAMAGLNALLTHWPQVDGIVLRFGETDAPRLPHLMGNDVYSPHCPRCDKLSAADRIAKVLAQAHKLVVGRHGKRLIARAWHLRPNGMHDTPQLMRELAPRLPGDERDDRLILSFKFTHSDFWRYQRWNPASLTCGNRPIIYELQCQREYEGKGGIPNWQVPLWRDGLPEMREAETRPSGLAAVHEQVNLAGLWAWVRGGGWGGPFVSSEHWIDANVVAVPALAEEPTADPTTLGQQWIRQRLGVSDERLVEALSAVLEHTPRFIRQAFYIEPLARQRQDPWHPSGGWIRDDLVDAAAAWRIMQRLSLEQLDAAVQEKEAAAERISEDRARLQQLVSDRRHRTLQPLVNTLLYTESLFNALRELISGLAAYRRYREQGHQTAAGIAQQKLLAAQGHWNHHVQRDGALPGTATPFRESQFWSLTQQILTELSASQP